MKRSYLFVLILVLLTVSLFPGSALAKAPQPVSVDVYNHSGSALTVLITNKITGSRAYLNLGTGVTTESLSQGTYDYSVTTPCGFETGTWNVTPGRVLWITCSSGRPIVAMTKLGACEIGIYFENISGTLYYLPLSSFPPSMPTIQDYKNWLDTNFSWSHPYSGCWSSSSGASYLTP